MSDRVRRLLAVAEELGFRRDGHDGRGHLRLVHSRTGERYQLAASPGDWHGDKNAIADMERIAARRLPRTQHRRSRKNFTVTSSAPTVAEKSVNTHFAAGVEELTAQAQALREEWDGVLADPSRGRVDRARAICREYDSLSDRLTALYQPPLPPLPTIGGPA